MDFLWSLVQAPFVGLGVVAFIFVAFGLPLSVIAFVIWLLKYAFGSKETYDEVLRRIMFIENPKFVNAVIGTGSVFAVAYVLVVNGVING